MIFKKKSKNVQEAKIGESIILVQNMFHNFNSPTHIIFALKLIKGSFFEHSRIAVGDTFLQVEGIEHIHLNDEGQTTFTCYIKQEADKFQSIKLSEMKGNHYKLMVVKREKK
jgi:hypothetical protein